MTDYSDTVTSEQMSAAIARGQFASMARLAHAKMDAALDPAIDPAAARILARGAIVSAQSARIRANSAAERAECADLIREAERVIR